MSAWKNGFKVVRCVNRRYFSAIGNYNQSNLRYQIGKETKPLPKCGPLAIFATLKDAEDFKSNPMRAGCTRIFRCWYTKSRQSCLFVGDGCHHLVAASLPQGTVLATRVIIVEEVSNHV
jgi:hypothetical protein